MAIGTTAAILGGTVIAAGAFGATSQAISGRQEAKSLKRAGEYNALVYEQQATMVENQQKVREYQMNRQRARMRSKIASQTAGKGLQLSGSPLAVMIDNETQMLFDQEVDRYNLNAQKNLYQSQAGYTRGTAYEQAKLAKTRGYSNAFSTILNTGSSFAMMNYSPKRGGAI